MASCSIQIHPASYGKVVIDSTFLNDIDLLFATDRSDFGGYSYAQSCMILESHNYSILPISMNDFSAKSIELRSHNKPLFMLTPIVKNDSHESKKVISKIINLSAKLGFKKLLFTQFIELKSKKELEQHQNFLGIIEEISEFKPKKDMELHFLLDKRYVDYYAEEFDLMDIK